MLRFMVIQQEREVVGNKPLILLIDKYRSRSPLLTQFYEYISRKDSPFEVIRDERLNSPLGRIVKDRLGGRIPDYIYWGFSTSTNLAKSKAFLKEHRDKFKIILGHGDTKQLLLVHNTCKQFMYSDIDFLVIRTPKIEEHRTMRAVRKFIATVDPSRIKIKNAIIINTPWGVNPDKYKPRNIPRDIDVSLVCTATPIHPTRRKAFSVIDGLSDRIRIYSTTHCGPKLTPTKRPLGDTFGDDYLDILYRSKLFIVDSAESDAPVQKYFEAPSCGSTVIGNIPTPLRDTLVHDVSAIVVNDFDKLGEVILDYLKRPDDIERIAQEGRRRILENFTVDKVSMEFTKVILDDYKRKG